MTIGDKNRRSDSAGKGIGRNENRAGDLFLYNYEDRSAVMRANLLAHPRRLQEDDGQKHVLTLHLHLPLASELLQSIEISIRMLRS